MDSAAYEVMNLSTLTGDLNVIVPGKFVHFSGPSDSHRDADGYPALTPDDYIDVFKKMGVTDIIRLNKICYDKTRFTRHGKWALSPSL